MLNYLIRLRQREEGFTLIELMIVMVVLGILSGIVLFGVANFRADAEVKATDVNARQCETAKVAWGAQNGLDPALATAGDLAGYFNTGVLPGGCP
jgi:general secretion pathway protein G